MKPQEPTLDMPSDDELVQALKLGEQEAFSILYERFLPLVYARVRFKVPTSDVEDVTQEIFIAILKSLHNFKGNAKLSTWIRTITNNKIADYHRSKTNVENGHEDFEKVAQRNLSSHRESAKKQEELTSIQQALGKLPQNYQDILMMRFVEDMPFHEIAQQNGQSLEATKSLFRRSIDALSKKMEEGR